MAKKKSRQDESPTPIRWAFDSDIPTHDFFEGRSLDDMGILEEAVDNLIDWLESDRFLAWEAVVCKEQGVALTARQRKALGRLFDFNDEDDDRVLYIDEIPRPSEPWHVILNKIVPHLLMEPCRTFDCHEDVQCDGWSGIVDALRKHGPKLTLPAGADSAMAVVPADLRHKLWLQSCFNVLFGLGQDGMSFEDTEEHYRIDWLIDYLRHCKESVAYFSLTLDSLVTRVILPARDQPVFLTMMQEKLGLSSAQEPIADRL